MDYKGYAPNPAQKELNSEHLGTCLGIIVVVFCCVVLLVLFLVFARTGNPNNQTLDLPQDTTSSLDQKTAQSGAASGSMTVNNSCGLSVICNIGDQQQTVGVSASNGAYVTTLGDCAQAGGSFTPDFADTSPNPKGSCMPKAQIQTPSTTDGGVMGALSSFFGLDKGILIICVGFILVLFFWSRKPHSQKS